jgi:hypothetical protein
VNRTGRKNSIKDKTWGEDGMENMCEKEIKLKFITTQ